jgi:hypothetical protein
LAFSFNANAQDESLLKSSTVPIQLLVKANAVVRYDHKKIDISSIKNLTVSTKRIVTVFNKEGIDDINAHLSYDSNITINKLEAIIYDKYGEKITKVRKSDFEDVSAVSNFSLYEDSRVKYLNYTPSSYPFTVEFHCETSTTNTAYLSSWHPLEGYYVSTENSKYEVVYDTSLETKTKEQHLEKYSILSKKSVGVLLYEVKNILAVNPEEYSIDFNDFSPFVKVALNKFHYEGYTGETNDWNTMGKWMYNELLKDRTVLNDETKTKIKLLVKNVEDPVERAKIVYRYMQSQTRYISVQEGIGGIQPEMASKVDDLKYGDCKGLTNYTKALMDAAGVKSHYTRVNASRSPTDVHEDFVTFIGQTNHVILNIPLENENIWLECTSQTSPFNYIANFTDDRDVFVLTPEGGKIIHTKVYETNDNLQSTNAIITISEDGSISADVIIKTHGYQYGLHEGIQNRSSRDQELHFKEYWDYINNISVENIKFTNDTDKIIFTENVSVSSANFGTKSGKRLLFQPNAFNRVTQIPTRYKKRTLDFEVERGYKDVDEFTITIDSNFDIEAMPNPVDISNKFGSYSFSIEKLSDSKLLYKRTQILNKGFYEKEEYKAFRAFKSAVVKHDKSKIVLISKT